MKLSKKMQRIAQWCLAIMWIPFGVFMLGMFRFSPSDYARLGLPPLPFYSLVLVVGLAFAAILLTLGAHTLTGLTNRAILTRGQPAEAKILKISDTGTTINRNPVVRLLLEVHPLGEAVFQAETEGLIPFLQIPQIQPGAMVRVKYDPTTKEVALIMDTEA